ncbi:iron-containing alcohol dehydrogenase family protein [Xanthovirga aplysinae]|uniref:iron-containing alcohol dehydrogenase family protein n=1 Tax=Xanthovirga aplysinae TaxID=2529853 RepID=UPI0012BD19CF|nr:iron-containing alcohol dehydrogenase family protein [Xanthovirga aplysinae]MTI30349.1 iron-containing alcohol dehydrogenase [Xanthovirga aplysinae]
MLKNCKNVSRLVFGKGSFDELDRILHPIRVENEGYMVFVVDKYFQNRALEARLPLHKRDSLYFIDVNLYEPKTTQIDVLRDEVLDKKGLPAGVIGIGGGSIMDIAKALSLMLTNKGSSASYQGLNLIKNPGVYHCGIPTISGTGAECSTTAVLTGPNKKLGVKCDWTVFDQLILDPELTATVPAEQWFYTGMDCYIHCVEANHGQYQNAFSKAYSQQAMELCQEVFLKGGSGQNPENNEKLMIASLMGGYSLTYSEVGVCHALSYGLSYILGYRHGLANCLVFNHLNGYYPKGVREFQEMVKNHHIELPQGLAKNWTSDTILVMSKVAYGLDHMWRHALGLNWKEKVSLEKIQEVYYRL